MTTNKTFKHAVRSRMSKTGESYTSARDALAKSRTKTPPGPAFTGSVSEARLEEKTGRGWDAWFAVLDAWNGTERTHPEIVKRLMGEHDVPGWWAQTITVNYERARGLREPGQRSGGFAADATKTIDVPIKRLFEAFHDPRLRKAWLPDARMRVRTAKSNVSARFDWEDGSTRVVAGFDRTPSGKSRVSITHEKLPDRKSADAMKAFWRERLAGLKVHLEDR